MNRYLYQTYKKPPYSGYSVGDRVEWIFHVMTKPGVVTRVDEWHVTIVWRNETTYPISCSSIHHE